MQRTSTSYFPRQFTPGWIVSFLGRFAIAFILLFNSNFLTTSTFYSAAASNEQPVISQAFLSVPEVASSNNSTFGAVQSVNSSIPADICDPLQVITNTDVVQCGTLRYAINFLTSNPNNVSKTINLALTPGSEIVPGSGYLLPVGASLSANCGITGSSVSIIGNGFIGDGLTLSGSNIITGVQVGGFKGVQIKTTGTNNKLSCTKTSTILTSTTVILPPDPGKVATPVDPTTATDVGTSTAFLYTGSNPIQTGVASGTITKTRAAVLRGKVLDRQNQPVGGVKIQILNHSEYGQTLSRADGMFDMAVNGGDNLTISYSKEGYLGLQRTVDVPWQDYENVDDVILTQLDPAKTDVNLAVQVGMTVVRSSQVTDTDGTRRATLLVPSGTSATMTLSGGITQSITNLSIRGTEYTVGNTGPDAMPGTLPASSGYTYAIEWSVDQAQAVGALRVDFNQPVIQYLENFLHFNTGELVPAGYYDREKGIWVADKNGLVVKIVSITNGLANLDTNGDDVTDSGVGVIPAISMEERQQLATLYSAGQSFWRVPLAHFSAWDPNWPFGPPEDAEPPDQPPPSQDGDACGGGQSNSQLEEGVCVTRGGSGKPDDGCHQPAKSDIECQGQVLHETLPVQGTPFSLNYSSDRVPGRKDAYTIHIPLTGATVPTSLKRIELEIMAAGQVFTTSMVTTATNQTYTYTWDGKDAYGRTLQGVQQVTTRVGYVYDGVYLSTKQKFGDNYDSVFGHFSYFGSPATGDKTRQEVTIWQDSKTMVGAWDDRPIGLGGWSLSSQQSYDPYGQILYKGDGSRQSAQELNAKIISQVSTNYLLSGAYRVALGPDGSIYLTSGYTNTIVKLAPDGTTSVVAGGGTPADGLGDNGPATQAQLYGPLGVAVGPDNSIYILDAYHYRVRKVNPNGIITTIAGNGTYGSSGDGGKATSAEIAGSEGFDLGPDGSVYIAETATGRIRRVEPNGIISTIAGGGNPADNLGDGGPATQARLWVPTDVKVGPDGSIYIADFDSQRVRKIGADGIIRTIAGNSPVPCGFCDNFSGDGGPATQAILSRFRGLAIASDGTVYISDEYNNRIRMVSPNGIINTIVGGGTGSYSDGGTPAIQVSLGDIIGLAVSPNGNLYIVDRGSSQLLVLSSSLPGLSVNDFYIPSQDGTEAYLFNAAGKHLRTRDTITGANLYQFGYDSAGRLTSITDVDGQITTIQHDTNGNPTSITNPYGQITTLITNANGYLASFSNQANETYQMSYSNDGLLTGITDPNHNPATMTYDTMGRLIKDQDSLGGYLSIGRLYGSNDYTVTISTALSKTTTYNLGLGSTGNEQRKNTDASGQLYQSGKGTDGTRTSSMPDGSSTNSTLGPDPRFGMQVPLTISAVYTAGTGLVATTTTGRTTNLLDPNDPFSLSSQTDTVTINNRTYTEFYDASSKTFTTYSPQYRSSTTTINDKGRVTSEQIAGLDPTYYTYDSQGRLTNLTSGSGVDTRSSNFSYFGSGVNKGNLQTITDPLSRQVSFAYDNAGRVTSQTLPGSRTIIYTYDSKGNLTSLTPPGTSTPHTFTYNSEDLPLTYKAPAVTGGGTNQTTYSYNLDKQLTGITFPDSSSTGLGYDSAGRLSSVSTPSRTVNYTYSATTGQLTGINVAGSGAPTLAYNYNGSLLAGETFSGPVSGSVSQTYDNNLWVTSQSVNGSNTVNFSYDNDGLLTNAGDLTLTRDFQNGLVTGSNLGNINTNLTYSSFGELSGYTAQQGSSVMYDISFTRDKLGRITQKIETIGVNTDTYTYSYDAAGRLSGVQKNGITTASYTYDANGNRLTGPGGATGSYDAQDRLLSYGANTYTYNARGDLATKTNGSQITTYQYDVESNLLGATLPDGTQISYIVDGNNRRIGKKVNGTLMQGFLYQDDLRPIADLDGSGNIVSRFVYASASNVPSYMVKGGISYRFVTNQVGSVRLVINTSTGAIAQQMDYDEFGNVLTDTSPGFQPFGFAGGIYDLNTKVTRFGDRDYDPETGRWTTKEPKGLNSGNTNLYNYCYGDPTNFVDYTGNVVIVDDIAIISTIAFLALLAAYAAAHPPYLPNLNNDSSPDSSSTNENEDQIKEGASCPLPQRKTPNTGDPGSTNVNSSGNGQERKYGNDGLPEYDIDWHNDHSNVGTPHAHNWENGIRGDPVGISPIPRGRGRP